MSITHSVSPFKEAGGKAELTLAGRAVAVAGCVVRGNIERIAAVAVRSFALAVLASQLIAAATCKQSALHECKAWQLAGGGKEF